MGDRMSGFNLLFSNLGLDFLVNRWHTTPNWGIAAIALAAIWQMSGYTMALYLGGLRAIPDELREAAQVDGASEFQIYRHIILPLLEPGHPERPDHPGAHLAESVRPDHRGGRQATARWMCPPSTCGRPPSTAYFFGRGAAIGILLLISVAVLIIPYLRLHPANGGGAMMQQRSPNLRCSGQATWLLRCP